MTNISAPSGLSSALTAFSHRGNEAVVRVLGRGNINDTFLVDDGESRFVLQRINPTVFPNPDLVVVNFARVSDHIAAVLRSSPELFHCARPVPTLSGELGYHDEECGCWRAQTFIDHLPAGRIAMNGDSARQLGRVLGCFHLLTADLDVALLAEPIPGFHVTPFYLEMFDRAAAIHRGNLSADLRRCLACVERFREVADRLERAARNGSAVRRTIHGDPKLDNVIFTASGVATGLFDLDTAGPGLVHHDLGDCLRSCCNRAGEEAAGGREILFALDLCEAVLAGYLQTAGQLLDGEERALIYDAALVITFELGLRFLTDHLRGDRYFKVRSAGENLRRALVQFRLAESIASQEREIRALIDRLGAAAGSMAQARETIAGTGPQASQPSRSCLE